VNISFDNEAEAAEWLRVAREVGALSADARVIVARMSQPPPAPEVEVLHEPEVEVLHEVAS
jgi:hypothetical protein